MVLQSRQGWFEITSIFHVRSSRAISSRIDLIWISGSGRCDTCESSCCKNWRMISHSFIIISIKIKIHLSFKNHVKNPVSVAFNGCTTFLERILCPFSTNAYIYISLDGTNLCDSGRRAYDLIMTNYLGITRIKIVGTFVLMLASLFIGLVNFWTLTHLLQVICLNPELN